MANLRDIKRRIKSVKNTQQITGAMKMVSAAKLRRAEDDLKAARPYASKIAEMVGHLSTQSDSEPHLLTKTRQVNKREFVIITSDRGLCGAFNSNVLKKAEEEIRKSQDDGIEVSLTLIGRKAQNYFKRRKYKINKEYEYPGRSDYGWAASIGDYLIDCFIKGTFDEVHVIFEEFQSVMVQIPMVKRLLPVELKDTSQDESKENSSDDYTGDYIFEPSKAAILSKLLPQYVNVLFYTAFLESVAGENGARMTAMDSATKNASEMIAKLTLFYNRARQAAITAELMDLVNGVESMKES